MILSILSAGYGAVATWRRRYSSHPSRQRRLAQPVISVGNLRAGGSGKTPVVAELARILLEHGERPAILSRGYRRLIPSDGVTVVSDGSRLCAEVASAGDEPYMLARRLPAVPVLVGADRLLSGQLAESRFGTTVHLLDDGFQHVMLARAVDLLLLDEQDLVDRVLPAGRLREPLSAARFADAVLTTAAPAPSAAIRAAVRSAPLFHVDRAIGAPRLARGGAPCDPSAAVIAVAGIAAPERFFNDLVAAGWRVTDKLAFPDHHWYSRPDVERIRRVGRSAAAAAVLTTEKDAVRFERCDLADLPLAVVPLRVTIEPGFADWIIARLRAWRESAGASFDKREAV